MRKLVLLWMLVTVIGSNVAIACDNSCVTVFKVVDCENNPVEGATITVRCKSGGSVTGTTGNNGLVDLRICTSDIKEVDVTAQIVEGKAASCSSSPCTIKLCFQSSESIRVD